MFRIRVEEPDGSIAVYGGRSIDEAVKKLKAARTSLRKILLQQGLAPDPWEDDLIAKVDNCVSEFCS